MAGGNFFRMRLILCIGLILVLASGSLRAQISERQMELLNRLRTVAEEVENCGSDLNCHRKKAEELKALKQELLELIEQQTPNGPPQNGRQEQPPVDVESLKAQMAHREHGQCYFCEADRERVRQAGLSPDFLLCVPAYISLSWDYSEQRNRSDPRIGPSSRLHCVIEEQFLGCLELRFETKNRKKLQQVELRGAYPIDPAKATRTITRISNSFGLSQPAKFPSSGVVYSTATTGNPDHFELDSFKENHSLKFEFMAPVFNIGTIRMPEIKVRDELFVPKGWDIIELNNWGDDVFINLDSKVFTGEEIYSAYRSKKTFTKTLPYHRRYFMGHGKLGVDHIKDAKVTVKIRFGPAEEPGLQVSPQDGLIASGPDKRGKFKPDRKTYVLTNTGKDRLQYTVHAGRNWVTVSRKSGTLSPKASTRVTVAVNGAKAKGLQPDQLQDTVRFTNVTNGRGNTTRPVKLVKHEKWRVTWVGWDTLYFGDKVLAGGIKPYWEVRVDFVIENGKYKEGQGSARFLKFVQHTHPPGVYDCEPLKGYAVDANLKKYPSPYIRVRNFNVPGSCTSSSANLDLPKENYYLVDYYCVMDTDRAQEAFGKKYGEIDAKFKVQQSRKYASIEKNGRLLPSARQRIPLRDGWKENFGETKSMDAHYVEVKRIE